MLTVEHSLRNLLQPLLVLVPLQSVPEALQPRVASPLLPRLLTRRQVPYPKHWSGAAQGVGNPYIKCVFCAGSVDRMRRNRHAGARNAVHLWTGEASVEPKQITYLSWWCTIMQPPESLNKINDRHVFPLNSLHRH